MSIYCVFPCVFPPPIRSLCKDSLAARFSELIMQIQQRTQEQLEESTKSWQTANMTRFVTMDLEEFSQEFTPKQASTLRVWMKDSTERIAQITKQYHTLCVEPPSLLSELASYKSTGLLVFTVNTAQKLLVSRDAAKGTNNSIKTACWAEHCTGLYYIIYIYILHYITSSSSYIRLFCCRAA